MNKKKCLQKKKAVKQNKTKKPRLNKYVCVCTKVASCEQVYMLKRKRGNNKKNKNENEHQV